MIEPKLQRFREANARTAAVGSHQNPSRQSDVTLVANFTKNESSHQNPSRLDRFSPSPLHRFREANAGTAAVGSHHNPSHQSDVTLVANFTKNESSHQNPSRPEPF